MSIKLREEERGAGTAALPMLLTQAAAWTSFRGCCCCCHRLRLLPFQAAEAGGAASSCQRCWRCTGSGTCGMSFLGPIQCRYRSSQLDCVSVTGNSATFYSLFNCLAASLASHLFFFSCLKRSLSSFAAAYYCPNLRMQNDVSSNDACQSME